MGIVGAVLRVPNWLRPWLRRLNFDLVRYSPRYHPLARRAQILSSARIDLVLDIGANIGQYARELRSIGYRGRIVSFEPVVNACAELQRAARRDRFWTVECSAIGDHDGEATINLAGNSLSSSFLEMLPAHVASAPESAYVGSERVKVRTLESALVQHRAESAHPFVKLDVQGFEERILRAAGPAMEGIAGFQLEMSLTPLYRGEGLFYEILSLLSEHGFTLVSLEPGHVDPESGRLLQTDGIFLSQRILSESRGLPD